MNLSRLIFIGGTLHFGILLASALVPQVLNWKTSLAQLDRLSRQLIWVHGAFIVFVIIGFGLLSTLFSTELAAHTPLARALSSFIALFWAARLCVQFAIFDSRPYLTYPLLRLGYHCLTLVFVYHTLVYAAAAF